MNAAEPYGRISPKLTHRPGSAISTRVHTWILSRSRLDAAYVGFGHYRSPATRQMPVVILQPR
jgi:hypothetical protein